MKLSNPIVMKWLKLVHVLLSAIWIGGVVIILYLCTKGMSNMGSAIDITSVYSHIILPVALLMLVSGVIYGAITKWGFFKHGWITAKWILVLGTGLSTGFGSVNNFRNVVVLEGTGNIIGATSCYRLGLLFVIAQVVMLCVILYLSVFKPHKKK